MTGFKEQFGYQLSSFDDKDINGYAELYQKDIGKEVELIEQGLKTLSIIESEVLSPEQINNKLLGVLNMNGVNQSSNTWVGTLTKQLVSSGNNFNIKELPTARKEVFNELLVNAELPQTLRDVITITNDEHVETLPTLTYIKDKLAANGIELSLNGSSKYFDRREGHIYTEVSDSVVHGSDRTLDELLKEIFINECVAYETTLLLDKNNASGLIDKDNQDLSLYNQGIKEVSNTSMYDGIKQAMKDIPQTFRRNVSIVMNTDHHDKLIKELAQMGLGALAGDLNKLFNVSHVVITDDAQDIFVGDFAHAVYAKYEPIMYNKKKQAFKGIYQFSLNYVFDIKVVAELLRIVKIN
ncbi:phage capsid protein [Staphylococcus simulans]|uniref:phage capsid protein n=1 Tax=Staphylococcus simulans TaxID=1286 RepID=UPI000D026D79|nr:phage capsid protein [Staphylococcus simulans]PTI99148.1 phage capsid protein [Staphylococcus simulans]PTJ26717.1 phage capsid protein [Staphylococcus simulans]PTJ49885.1 phage capsid protein [Staphylococcus simulans]RIN42670.1 phage capsid protein [Staphylococcus simulans]RIN64742.1 phage capsid protein [Staphylococcus simulans]